MQHLRSFTQNFLHTSISKYLGMPLISTVGKFSGSIPIKRIGIVLLLGIAAYILLTLLFATLFLMTNSITKSNGSSINFLDCFYFSCVTFLTIGYGDIVPKSGIGQMFVFFESVCSMAFTPLFGGFLVYKLLQRPKDILLTENFFLRYRNNKILFSVRIGNQGKKVIDCKAKIEFARIINNVKKTLFSVELSTPSVEFTWFLDIRLDDERSREQLKVLKSLFEDEANSMIRVSFWGIDVDSGNLVCIDKTYKMNEVKFGGGYKDVYDWKGTERTKPNWNNLNEIQLISDSDKEKIDTLLFTNTLPRQMPASPHKVFELPQNLDSMIWRYMDFTKFISMLENSGIYFARLDKLGDPFEGAASKFNKKIGTIVHTSETEVQIIPSMYSNFKHHLAWTRQWHMVSCWHMNQYESAAMWNLYAKTNEAIAIQTTCQKLINVLDEKCYVGKVSYIDYENTYMPEGNFYYPVTHKRLSFAHEQELRAVYTEYPKSEVSNNAFDYNLKNDKFGVWKKINMEEFIENIYVAPTSPVWFKELVSQVLVRYGLTNVNVIQSSLDEQIFG
jgi:hypothetical protein